MGAAVAVEARKKLEQWPRGHGSARARADKEGAVLQERAQYRVYGVSTRRRQLTAPDHASSATRAIIPLASRGVSEKQNASLSILQY